MTFKTFFFLFLFVASVLGPAGIQLCTDENEIVSYLTSDEEHQEGAAVDVEGEKTLPITLEIAHNFSILRSVANLYSSENEAFWTSIYSEKFHPPPETV